MQLFAVLAQVARSVRLFAVGTVAALLVIGAIPCSAVTDSKVKFVRVDWYPSGVAVYFANDTIYSASSGHNDVSVVNGATCNAENRGSCWRVHARQDVGVIPGALVINQRTKTLYVVDTGDNARTASVSAVSIAKCNATHTSGCTHYPHLPPAVHLPFNPGDVAVNEKTNTIYVDGGDDQLAVINGRSCNATVTRGCHIPFIGRVRGGAGAVAVNPITNTIYVVDYFTGIVSVIDGRSCNRVRTSGCNHAVATFRVGRHPWRLTVDTATDTIYVSNYGSDTVSVINGALCNGTIRTGCGHRPPVIHVGRGPQDVAVDDRNHFAFVTNPNGNAVHVFDASTCNGQDTSGCGQKAATISVEALPSPITVNERTATVYVADMDTAAPGRLAMFRTAIP